MAFFVSVALFFGGLTVSAWYGRSTKQFRWSTYILLVTTASTPVLWLYIVYGMPVLYFYVLSCIWGPLVEYGIGRAYHVALGERMWMYHRYSFGGHTSYLIIPFWGVFGVMCMAAGKIFI